MSESNVRVGFIGAGMMATALMKGFAAAGIVSTDNMIGTDVSQFCLDRLTSMNIRAVTSNSEVVQNADVIFLAVKPYVVAKVLKEVASLITKDKLIVSIAAGVTIASMEALIPSGSKVIRVMPNTPCSVGASASAYVAGTNASKQDMEYIGKLLNAVGLGIECGEGDINGVTAVSGSGPAYVFLMIEAMADGGVRAGLPRDVALKLAAQTVKGAAQMVIETGTHPGVLKDQVCSPGGTTIAGVAALESHGLRNAAIEAVTAAKARADELSRSNI